MMSAEDIAFACLCTGCVVWFLFIFFGPEEKEEQPRPLPPTGPGAGSKSIGTPGEHVGGYYLGDADSAVGREVPKLSSQDRIALDVLGRGNCVIADDASIVFPSGAAMTGTQMRQRLDKRLRSLPLPQPQQQRLWDEHRTWNDGLNRKIRKMVRSGADGGTIHKFVRAEIEGWKQYESEFRRRNGG